MQMRQAKSEYLTSEELEKTTRESRWAWRGQAQPADVASLKFGKCLPMLVTELELHVADNTQSQVKEKK